MQEGIIADMNMENPNMKFLPVLSFPVARKLGHSVGEFVKSADLQAETMAWIARNTPVDAVLGPMDLSVEAEAFGANVRFSDNEVPVVTGQLVSDEDAVAALAVPPPDAGRCAMTAAAIAKEGGYDYFTTTLTISPLKRSDKINEIGNEVAEQYGVAFLPSDFKKRGGYLRSIELSRQYNLYRQNFCGCVFSKREEAAADE